MWPELMWKVRLLAAIAGVAGSVTALPTLSAPGDTAPSRLTRDGRRKQDLRWSPDGTQLAFSLYVKPGQIRVALARQGAPELQILGDQLVEFSPSWSADGKRLAFVHVTHSGTDGELDIYTMTVDGSDRQALVANKRAFENCPRWSPDGQFLAFTTNRDRTQEIYVTDAAGTTPRRITNDSSLKQHPSWSPDGKRLVFNSNREGTFDLWTVRADGTALSRLTDHPSSETRPVWSPDGRKIAFTTLRDGDSEIYVVDADGKNPLNISRNSGFDDCAEWSRDGKSVTWVSDRDGGIDVYELRLN